MKKNISQFKSYFPLALFTTIWLAIYWYNKFPVMISKKSPYILLIFIPVAYLTVSFFEYLKFKNFEITDKIIKFKTKAININEVIQIDLNLGHFILKSKDQELKLPISAMISPHVFINHIKETNPGSLINIEDKYLRSWKNHYQFIRVLDKVFYGDKKIFK